MSNQIVIGMDPMKREKRERTMPKCDINSPRLIGIVQKFDCLWNFNIPSYHSSSERSSAWEKVAACFHDATAKDCLEQWTKIRNAFQNQNRKRASKMRSGADASNIGRPYKYAKQLSFLIQLKDCEDEIQEGTLQTAKRKPLIDVNQIPKKIKFTPSDFASPTLEPSTPNKVPLDQTVVTPPNKVFISSPNNKIIVNISPTQTFSENSFMSDKNDITVKKKGTGARKGRARKVSLKTNLGTISESEFENEDDPPFDDVQSIDEASNIKIKKQKLLAAKREDQAKRIKERAQQWKGDVKTKLSQRGAVPTTDTALQDGMLQELFKEEDRFTYFASSLIEPLRKLPLLISSKLCVEILSLVSKAECDFLAGKPVDQPVLPDLMAEVEIEEIFNSNEDEMTVLQSKFGIKVMLMDMKTLASTNWLNDAVINFYFQMLQNDNEDKRVFAFESFFYVDLKRGNITAALKFVKVNPFKMDLLLVPVCESGHWYLATINIPNKVVTIYNSFDGRHPECIHALLEIMEVCADRSAMSFNSQEWDRTHALNVPSQTNGYDCGVFVCVYAEHLVRGRALNFTENDMPYFRKKIATEIVLGTLL